VSDHNKPPKKGETIQATPYPSRHVSPESSDETRLRAPTSFPNLLEVPPELPLTRVDASNYEVGDEVARGGLGRILRAHDKRLNRIVAIKVLRVRDRDAEIRFMREALVTAKLQHPAIVPIYEAGRWPDGEPFYAMKLLEGKSLSDLVAERPALADRLALLPNCIAVADAIAYAHEHRVIHRDLKPANVMVGAYGETLVIDWGLAKDLDGDDDSQPGKSIEKTPVVFAAETIAGAILGTPAYMPPEQAAGMRVDERADVYALGAMLYHVLRGASPIDEMSPAEAMRRVMAGPLPDIATLVPGVPADLAAIVRKAMAHQRSQRYPSAKELAADLRRFQTGQLVSVRSYFWWERLWRWTLKNRALMAVVTAAALALVVIGSLSVRRVIEERNTAQQERRQADLARAEADRRTNDLVLVQALTALERDPTAALAWLKQHPGADVLSRLRTAASDAVSRGAARHVLRAHEGRVTGVAFGARGELVSIGADGRMVQYDGSTGAASALVEPPGVLWVLARAPDGKSFAVAGSSKGIRLVTPGSADRWLEHDGAAVLTVEWAPDGERLAAGSVNGKVWLWELASGQRRSLEAHSAEVRDLVFARDGARLASAGYDGLVRLHAPDTGESKPIRAAKEEIYSIDFTPDGRLLATGSSDGTVKLWDAAGAAAGELKAHRGQITQLVFSPDGRWLATASRDHDVRLWAAPFKEPSRVLEGHTGDVLRLEFSPDGRTLASASQDATVRLWSVSSGDVRVLQGHESQVGVIAFSPDGRLLASAGQDGSVRVWPTEGAGAPLGPPFSLAALSEAGTSLAGVARRDGNLLVLDRTAVTHTLAGAGFRFAAFTGEDRVVAVDGAREVIAWTPSSGARVVFGKVPVDVGSAVEAGGWIAVGAYDGTIRLWRLGSGESKVWSAHPTYTLALAASPDGKTIASSGEEGVVKLWDVAAGTSRSLKGHVGPVHQVRFSGDGSLLASGDLNGEARVWRVGSGELVLAEKHRGFVRTVAFSRDGALLASGGDDKTIHVRRVAGGEPAVVLTGPEQPVFDLAFSPDAELLVAGSADRTVRVYEWGSGAARVLRSHGATVARVQFVADGTAVVSVDAAGGVRRWTREEVAPLPASRLGLAEWIDAVTTARIDSEHRPASPR